MHNDIFEEVELIHLPRAQDSPSRSTPRDDEEDKTPIKKTATSSNRLNRLNQLLDRTTTWKISLLIAAITSIIVLFFNLGFVLWAISHRGLDDKDEDGGRGRGTLYFGQCDQARNISVGFHLVINVLATALLSASNYAMVVCHALPVWIYTDWAGPAIADLISNVYAPRRGGISIERMRSKLGWILVCRVFET